jgi:putative transposase
MGPKSRYNPRTHRRNSLRLKGYDYSQPGLYFLTICCQDRMPCFGYIIHSKMHLSDAGKMIEKWYFELENKFPHIKCHAMVVMPDHFHCMIEIITKGQTYVSAHSPNANHGDHGDHGDHANPGENANPGRGEHANPGRGEHANPGRGENANPGRGEHANPGRGEHIGSPLPLVIQWFKTMTTNEYIRGVKTLNWVPFNKKLWQRNYHDIIVRDNHAFQTISTYILQNPRKWKGNAPTKKESNNF